MIEITQESHFGSVVDEFIENMQHPRDSRAFRVGTTNRTDLPSHVGIGHLRQVVAAPDPDCVDGFDIRRR